MDEFIFAYTTKMAVDDGVLVKIDRNESQRNGILFPVYFTETVWKRYVEVPSEFAGIQDRNSRLADILFMFAWQAKKCQGNILKFKFCCQVPINISFAVNEQRCRIGFQHRDILLKAIIGPQDIYDASPAIFIMLPWED